MLTLRALSTADEGKAAAGEGRTSAGAKTIRLSSFEGESRRRSSSFNIVGATASSGLTISLTLFTLMTNI